MKRKFISKIILGTMISTTLFTLVPIKASAEWVTDYQNNWYYTQGNQKMIGWKRIDGQLYYFDDNGKMQTGWIKAGDSWYFLQNNGALKTGWINYNKKLYYADSSGVIQTGIINIAGKVYIFDNNGAVKTSNTVINGQFYTIGLDGQVAGNIVPTPDKEFDGSGRVLAVLKNTNSNVTDLPTSSKINEVIEDKTVSNDDPNEGRTFKVRFKDSNGAELDTKNIKNGKKVELYEPTKIGYIFSSWNTKSDGSGKSYDDNDNIKVNEDINLYAQWTGDSTIYVTGITITGNSGVQIGKTVQMTATILPEKVANSGVTWSISSGKEYASIDSNGVITGVSDGTVIVTATSKDGSNISATKKVGVGKAIVEVSVISIGVTSDVATITSNAGTLQMNATVLPKDATDQSVTWSIENDNGTAKISPTSGILTAVTDGTVIVMAKDSSGTVVGRKSIKITGQSTKILVSKITVTPAVGGVINVDDGTLKMGCTVEPANAGNKTVKWSVEQAGDTGTLMDGKAEISSTGVLKAISNGKVKVKATSTDGSEISSIEREITISKQVNQAMEITIDGEGGIRKIVGPTDTTLQMKATVLPENAEDKAVTWSLKQAGDSGTIMDGRAEITTDGMVTAVANGKVEVIATSVKYPKLSGRRVIEINGQVVPLVKISSVSGQGNINEITRDKASLQLVATLEPTYTTQKDVEWEFVSGEEFAKIDKSTGILTAIGNNGAVTVRAKSKNNPTIVSEIKEIKISGQYIKVTDIQVTSTTAPEADGTYKIATDDGTLQMLVTVSPTGSPNGASNPAVTWSVEQEALVGGILTTEKTDRATIGLSSGILQGVYDGEVIVKATATDGSKVVGKSKIIKLSNQKTKVQSVTIGGPDTVVAEQAITLSAGILPDNASDSTVTWSFADGNVSTANATIDSSGVFRALLAGGVDGKSNVTVTVKATANDGSGKTSTKVITITPKIII